MSESPNKHAHHPSSSSLRVLIVGAGLGGLAASIALLRHQPPPSPSSKNSKISVTILEKCPLLSEVGAGIQLPPNATKVMADFNLLPKLYASGMIARKHAKILRWEDGRVVSERQGGEWNRKLFGNDAHTMHRADYQRVLVEEAKRLGAEIELGCDVVRVECDYPPRVILADGRSFDSDVVMGADGLRSSVRTSVLGYVKEPEESGDMAYRITIPMKELENDIDTFISGIAKKEESFAVWWGPNRHVVLYSVRNYEVVNLVVVVPDDLPHEVSKQPGNIEEMYKLFEGWDPRLRTLLSKVDSAVKWKIYGMEELDTWVRGSAALLGDACHPMVPYAALGAAMAVEDGAVLGRLIELFAESGQDKASLPELMQLYQDVRKQRTVAVVGTANENRSLYHMEDGPEQQERDRAFAEHDWYDENVEFPWKYGNIQHCQKLFGLDALKSAEEAWESSRFFSMANGVW